MGLALSLKVVAGADHVLAPIPTNIDGEIVTIGKNAKNTAAGRSVDTGPTHVPDQESAGKRRVGLRRGSRR